MNEKNASYDNFSNVKFELRKSVFNEIIYLFIISVKKFVLCGYLINNKLHGKQLRFTIYQSNIFKLKKIVAICF